MRPSGRAADALREIRFSRDFTCHAEGSVLAEFGRTKVICTATVEERVPRWMRNEERGWITAEYGMLPRSTHDRMGREAARGKQGGRTVEIQRLIGRSLRAALDLKAFGPRTVTLDCDVIQADGGTRTTAISGAWVALADAIAGMLADGRLEANPIKHPVAAVSVGIVGDTPVLDLDYDEDCTAETDMNVVMTGAGDFIEIQGTAEGEPFPRAQLDELLRLADVGIQQIMREQQRALEQGR